MLCKTDLGEDCEVQLPPRREVLLTQQHGRMGTGEWVFSVEVSGQTVPVLETDLEYLLLIHL